MLTKKALLNQAATPTILIFFALLITWPLILNMNGFVLPESYPDISHSDSMQHLGKLSEARALSEEGKFPLIIDSTDVSQVYIYTGLLITGLGISDIAFHNLHYLAVLILAGYFMYLLAEHFTKDRLISTLAGAFYLTSMYISYAYYWGHSNTISIHWIPLIFLLTEKTISTKNYKIAIVLGLVLVLQLISSSYAFIFLSFLLPIYLLLRVLIVDKSLLKQKKTYYAAIVSGISFILLSGWYLIKRVNIPSTVRTLEENSRDYWRLHNLADLVTFNSWLFIGIAQIILFGYACFYMYVKKEYRRFIPFLVLAIFVIVFAIGPISNLLPYYWFYKLWPYADHLRVPLRSMAFAHLSIAMVATVPLIEARKHLIKNKFQYLIAAVFLVLILQTLLNPWTSGLQIYYP